MHEAVSRIFNKQTIKVHSFSWHLSREINFCLWTNFSCRLFERDQISALAIDLAHTCCSPRSRSLCLSRLIIKALRSDAHTSG